MEPREPRLPKQPPFQKTFPTPSRERWREVATASLKGRSLDDLRPPSDEGLSLPPLSTAGDPSPDAASLPPWTRGAGEGFGDRRAWDVRTLVDDTDLERAAAAARDDVEGGTTSLRLVLAVPGRAGVPVRAPGDLDRLLADIPLDRVGLGLDAGPAFAATAALLARWLTESGYDLAHCRCELGADPLGAAAGGAVPTRGIEASLAELRNLHTWACAHWPAARVVTVDSGPHHEAGAHAAQEIGATLATGVAYLRALEPCPGGLEAAAGSFAFRVAAGPRFFTEAARLRAMRRLWCRVLELAGVDASRVRPPRFELRPGRRRRTRRAPWINALRHTAATFAGAVGGADAIVVPPHDATGDRAVRRLARNTQIVMLEESGLHRVIDPAGGSHHVEALTEALCAAGWAEFQEIERQGGMLENLRSGRWAQRLADTQAYRAARIARRTEPLLGVNEYARLDDTPPAVPPAPPAPVWASEPGAAHAPAAGADRIGWCFDRAADLTLPALDRSLGDDVDEDASLPLPVVRLDADFELLRSAVDAREEPPRVLLAIAGSRAAARARIGFARSYLAAGGLDAVEADGDADRIADTLRREGCRMAVICGSDEDYAGSATPLARALVAAGAETIWIAGRPGEHETTWRAAGISGWIALGDDVVEQLRAALTATEGVS